MTIWKKIRRFLFDRPGAACRSHPQAFLTAGESVAKPAPPGADISMPVPGRVLPPVREIDFSRSADLDTYTENLRVPEEDIRQWISAGLLFPEELRNAERMLKILRKKTELSRAA